MSNNASSPVTKGQLEVETAEQYSTISDVWAALVDVDESSTKRQLLDAVDEACQIISEFDPEEFSIEDDDDADAAAA
jgi:hypothetical protein